MTVKFQKLLISSSSDVSHLFLIDPLVETLFDNEQWKDYWYNKIIPRLHAMQLSAAIGINRILVLTHMIETPLVTKTSDDTEDDNININHRQVIEFELKFLFFLITILETFTL